MNSICPLCGKEFDAFGAAKYCSPKCKSLSRSAREHPQVNKKCVYCGKEFTPIRSTKIYCSTSCMDKASYEREYPKTDKVCSICGKSFTPNKAFQSFCSHSCQRKNYYNKNKEKFKESRKNKYWSNPENAREKTKEWRLNNRDKYLDTQLKYHNENKFSGNKVIVLERDGYKCVRCGSTEGLNIHHKDRTGQSENINNEIDNLETLCNSCHISEHRKELILTTKVNAKCMLCGKEFETVPSRIKEGKAKYCSKKCSYESRTKRFPITCKTCGKVFEVPMSRLKTSNTQWCSNKCRYGK